MPPAQIGPVEAGWNRDLKKPSLQHNLCVAGIFCFIVEHFGRGGMVRAKIAPNMEPGFRAISPIDGTMGETTGK